MDYRDQNTGDATPNFEQMLKTFLDTELRQVWTCLPGIVKSFNADDQTAEVYPALLQQYDKEDGTVGERQFPVLRRVPVQMPQGGGFAVTLPIQQGNTGILLFASRCFKNWQIEGGVQSQAVRRMHDLSDAIFIPGINSARDKLPDYNNSAPEIRNLANNSVVTVADNNITIKNPAEVKIEAPALKFNTLNLGQHRHVDPQGGVTGPPIN